MENLKRARGFPLPALVDAVVLRRSRIFAPLLFKGSLANEGSMKEIVDAIADKHRKSGEKTKRNDQETTEVA